MALLPKWSSPQSASWIASAFAVLAHVPALGHRLLRDDVSSIRDNADLRTLTGLARIVRAAPALSDSDPGASTVRPIHAAFEWLVWELVRAQPSLQHVVSIALHALAAALVVRVLVAWKVDARIALASAIFFAVHPATAPAVAAISSRALVLGGVALAYAMARMSEAKSARAHATWIAFGAATSALAHEAFFASFVALFFLARKEWRRPAAIGAAIGAGLALVVARPSLGAPVESVGAAAAILGHGLLLGIVPFEGSSFFTPASIAWPLAAVVLFALAALVLFVARRVGPLAGAGLSLVVLVPIALAPAAVRGGLASDRSAWALLLGLAIAGGAIVEHARANVRPLSPLVALAPFALALALVPLTWAHVLPFRDDVALLEALAADRPDDPEGKLASALLASAKEEHAEAYPICAEYASQRPTSTRAHLCVGAALYAGGDPEGALVFLRRYTALHPDEERARRALVASLFATNQLAEARTWIVKWRTAYGKVPDVEAARAELVRRGAW